MQIRCKNPFDYFDNIYYINLDRRQERKIQTLVELSKYEIQAQRVPGVEHEDPATGCRLAHANVYKDAIENGYDRILVFEDDIEFFQETDLILKSALLELSPNWDMLYLGANLDAFPAYRVSPHIAKLTGAFSTHAHAVHRNLFSTLYDVNTNPNVLQNDVYYSYHIHPKYNCYLVLPIIAGQRTSYSDIQKTEMSSNQVFLDRVKTNLVE